MKKKMWKKLNYSMLEVSTCPEKFFPSTLLFSTSSDCIHKCWHKKKSLIWKQFALYTLAKSRTKLLSPLKHIIFFLSSTKRVYEHEIQTWFEYWSLNPYSLSPFSLILIRKIDAIIPECIFFSSNLFFRGADIFQSYALWVDDKFFSR